jgi:hypothetical protein
LVATSVAFVVVPDKEIIVALKLPDASRATIAEAVLLFVAVVAELDTFPDVEIVARYESAIVAVLERTPEPFVRTIPAVVRGVVIVPVNVGEDFVA